MPNPLRPEEAAAAKLAQIPDEVIAVFNELIARNFDGHLARIDQNDVIHAILSLGIVRSAQEIFTRHLLDIEPVYAAAGWIVSYDKPGYNETGASFFVFEQPR